MEPLRGGTVTRFHGFDFTRPAAEKFENRLLGPTNTFSPCFQKFAGVPILHFLKRFFVDESQLSVKRWRKLARPPEPSTSRGIGIKIEPTKWDRRIPLETRYARPRSVHEI